MKKIKTSVYLFPAALAVVFMSSILIIVSPLGSKTIIPLPIPTPTTIPKYTCPVEEWVDCLPNPGTKNPQCQKVFLDWAKLNCPKFKGAAL